MSEPASRFFTSARLKLHYVVWGDETKPAIVLVHGGRDHARNWDFVSQGLLDRYSIYAPDLRGHGDSDWAAGAYHLADFVLDLSRLVDVIDRGPVYVMGHSLGGRVVIDYAAARPERVRRFIAIEGFGRFNSRLAAPQRLRDYIKEAREIEGSEARYYRTIEDATARMQQAHPRLSPEMARHLTEHAVRKEPQGYLWKFDNFVRVQLPVEWTLEETKEIWADVTSPSIHIGGEESWGRLAMPRRHPEREVDRASLAPYLPHSRQIMVENAGHWVQHDQLDRVVEITRDFFRD